MRGGYNKCQNYMILQLKWIIIGSQPVIVFQYPIKSPFLPPGSIHPVINKPRGIAINPHHLNSRKYNPHLMRIIIINI